jgi:PAS domain-containing protein
LEKDPVYSALRISTGGVGRTLTIKCIYRLVSQINSGKLHGICSLNRSITGMDKTVSQHQNDLNSLSAWQQAILDSSEYGIISTDTKGVIATFNRTSEILLGYKSEEMVGDLI